MVLDDAELEELIPVDPCRKVRPPRVEPTPVRILAPDQPKRMIAAVGSMPESRRGPVDMDDSVEVWALLFELAFTSGMRAGERYALMPYELELRDGVPGIFVQQQIQEYGRPRRCGDPQMARRGAPVRDPVADHAQDTRRHAVRAHPAGIVGPAVGAHPTPACRPA